MVTLADKKLDSPNFCNQGGMKAVIWADAFQATIMFAGALAIIIQVSRSLASVTTL